MNYYILAEARPGVARGKIISKKNYRIFLVYNTTRPPMTVHNKFQPNRSSHLAGYTQYILYEYTNVLFYYIDINNYIS